MGWSTIKNGELPAVAAQEFDVFVAADRNLCFQQNVPAFAIAVIVLRAVEPGELLKAIRVPRDTATLKTAGPENCPTFFMGYWGALTIVDWLCCDRRS